MKNLKRFSAVILGIVLFLAGILKLMDPVGAGLVMHEYFKFMHMFFLFGISYPAGIATALIETILGAAMITGFRPRITALASIAVLGVFTVLTLFILIFNPNMDCGCFGEVVKLTHAQSFIKNIVFIGLWALAYLPVNKQEPTRKVRNVSFSLAVVSIIVFATYSAFSIPLMDFTKFKPGTEIMSVDGFEIPEESTIFLYSTADGEYSDSLILENRVMVASVYNPHAIKDYSWQNIAESIGTAKSLGFNVMVMAASTPEEMHSIVADHAILDNLYFADRKELMTINRSNGGMTYLDEGLIVSKWGVHNFPDREKMQELMDSEATESLIKENNRPRLKFQAFLLYVFSIMLLL